MHCCQRAKISTFKIFEILYSKFKTHDYAVCLAFVASLSSSV